MEGIKVAIGIPHAGDIKGYFFDTFLSLSRPANTPLVRVENKPIDLARNMIVEAALEDPDVTHLFFMDADMQFPTDAMFRLVQRDKDVIGGTYFARTENPVPHIYKFHHEDGEDGTCPLGWPHSGGEWGKWYLPQAKQFARFMKRHKKYAKLESPIVLPPTADTLIEADALGTGCMLIKREVLETVGSPWFKCHDGSAGGEDFYFCEKAKEAGFEVWGDFSVQCNHEYKHVWMEREDFVRRFRVGTKDEYDWDGQPVIVDAENRPPEPKRVVAR
jgi:glycosyltransferase involved in cell wall biosynthesis